MKPTSKKAKTVGSWEDKEEKKKHEMVKLNYDLIEPEKHVQIWHIFHYIK